MRQQQERVQVAVVVACVRPPVEETFAVDLSVVDTAEFQQAHMVRCSLWSHCRLALSIFATSNVWSRGAAPWEMPTQRRGTRNRRS